MRIQLAWESYLGNKRNLNTWNTNGTHCIVNSETHRHIVIARMWMCGCGHANTSGCRNRAVFTELWRNRITLIAIIIYLYKYINIIFHISWVYNGIAPVGIYQNIFHKNLVWTVTNTTKKTDKSSRFRVLPLATNLAIHFYLNVFEMLFVCKRLTWERLEQIGLFFLFICE